MMRVDNGWVVDGCQILLAGWAPDPQWEHYDLWHQPWEVLQTRAAPFRAQKVDGHLDKRDVEEGFGTTMLKLVVAKGYVAKLLANAAIAEYLTQHHKELLDELRRITDAIQTDQPRDVGA